MKPYHAACATAIVAVILAVVAVSTQEWIKEDGVTIGLWLVTDANGTSYSWINSGLYDDFFYAPWFMAIRGLAMCGVILGGLGIFLNFYIIIKNPSKGGTVLLIYYLLTFCSLVSAAATYSSMIPQPVANNNGVIEYYKYTASYGYSLWLCWISSGVFLMASGIAYEGSNQQKLAKKFEKLVNDV